MGTETTKSKSASKGSNGSPQQAKSGTKSVNGTLKKAGSTGNKANDAVSGLKDSAQPPEKALNTANHAVSSLQDSAQPSQKNDVAAQKKQANDVLSKEARRKQSAQLSNKSLQYKKKANELIAAANAAGDPDEREKLMEEAINYQIEAETFGKTAKYLQSGTFQGMAVGAGLGSIPGLTLGTLVGTLVGGTLVLVLGGVGALGGALTGWLHGPFWNFGQLAGKGLRKLTGDFLPGWKATGEQKRALEKMIGHVNEQDVSEAELTGMAKWDDAQEQGTIDSWTDYAYSWLPSSLYTPKSGSKTEAPKGKPPGQGSAKETKQTTPQKRTAADSNGTHESGSSKPSKAASSTSQGPQTGGTPQGSQEPTRRKPRKLRQQETTPGSKPAQQASQQAKKAPPKLDGQSQSTPSKQGRKPPRKLNK